MKYDYYESHFLWSESFYSVGYELSEYLKPITRWNECIIKAN